MALAAGIAVVAVLIGYIIGHTVGLKVALKAGRDVTSVIALRALTFIPADDHKSAIESMRRAIRDL